ncbi:unnamed protein product [Dovyalis caffra]|uniref:Uncharacterized protein n=1 Tax=Dovyalis caffra TaxID=77055 RepID=A0AAV1SHV4_9ROSI|nr:unnamed protein product [Dovyalis caffra]
MKNQITDLTTTIASIAQQLERIEAKITYTPHLDILEKSHNTPHDGPPNTKTLTPKNQTIDTNKTRSDSRPFDREKFPWKLELPVFNGEDPSARIFRTECYFSINELLEEEKLEACSVRFEGEARGLVERRGTVAEYGARLEFLATNIGKVRGRNISCGVCEWTEGKYQGRIDGVEPGRPQGNH